MRLLLPVMTAAAFAASCGFANAQATNYSITPGDAPSLSSSDTRDYRTEAQRRAMERRHVQPGNWNDPAWLSMGYAEPGWNSYGASRPVTRTTVYGSDNPWNGYTHDRPGWNSYGAAYGPAYGTGVGVSIGPFAAGVGFGDPGYHHRYHRYSHRHW